jgi:hypothetical protein
MKPKLNLNVAGLKSAVLAHGEKVLFGAGFLALMLFGYSAITRPSLPANLEPPKIADKVTTASRKIEEAHLTPSDKKIEERIYTTKVVVNPEIFKGNGVIDPQPEDRQKRDTPTLLAIEELRASGGRGLYSSAAAPRERPASGRAVAVRPAAGTTTGKFWAVVTGIVPVAKQEAEFAKALAAVSTTGGAKEKDKDAPHYSVFRVERAVVTGESVEKLKWVVIKPPADVKSWASKSGDVVDEKFSDPIATMSLPPILNWKWDESVAHPPQIPLNSRARQALEEETPIPSDEPEAEVEPAAEEQPAFPGFNVEQPEKAEPVVEQSIDEQKPGVRLFRFFDLTVEPGKQYRYRVQFGLTNPNQGVEAKFLKDPESAKPSLLITPLSEPSPVVTIPFGEQIFAGPIDKANRPNDPVGSVMLTQLNAEGGYEAVGKQEVTRGTPIVVRDPQYRDPAGGAVKSADKPIASGAVALDVDGGELLPGRDKLLEPVGVLVLNRQGMLEAHFEMDDMLAYQSKDLTRAASSAHSEKASTIRARAGDGEGESGGLFNTNNSAKNKGAKPAVGRGRGEESND